MRLTKEQYRQKLLDPRWQKKRLEILQRDGWACHMCTQDDKTLHVHHKVYFDGEPWDIPNALLVTLCAECHEYETESLPEAKKSLFTALARIGADSFTLDLFASTVEGMTVEAFEVVVKFLFRLTMSGEPFPVAEADVDILLKACTHIRQMHGLPPEVRPR